MPNSQQNIDPHQGADSKKSLHYPKTINSSTEKTLQNLFELFEYEMTYSKRLRPSTIRGYKAVFKLFEKVMPEITLPNQLSEAVMTLYFKRIQERKRLVGKDTIVSGVKSSTIKTQWNKLNPFYKWLERKGYLEDGGNPLAGMKTPSVRYDDYKTLPDEQVKMIYGAINMHSKNSFMRRRDALMVSIPLYCGLRKGEIIGLRVMDIDMEKRLLTVNPDTSKSKRKRVLPIPPTLYMHLKDYLLERKVRDLKTSFLIVSNHSDRGLSHEGIKHWTKSIETKSGVNFHLHMFRHNYAIKLDENNVSAFKIQKLMGHESITTTQRYVRSSKTESMAEDVAKISY